MNVKTRMAPSPTGYLHVGSLRTALYDYLYAKKHNGVFLLRVEDTDRNRLVEGAVESLLTIFDAVNIPYDEGPVLQNGHIIDKGINGPYIQSERTEIYKEYAQQLLDSDHAYHCFCTKERLDEVRQRQQAAKLPTKYDRTCLKLPKEEIEQKLEAGEPHVLRLKIPEGETVFEDAVRGTVKIPNSEIDDQVLMKSDGFPTYHLAVVVDDHLMGVTHIFRGEEWISSVPKHIILYEAFNFPKPVFAHLPLILNPDKSKLSKRQGDVAVEDYLEKGYLPEALINFIALLGFNPSGDQEIYTIDELIEGFDLGKINKSGAVFDTDKLDWMNGQYIKQADNSRLAEMLKGKEIDSEDDRLLKVIEIEKQRLSRVFDLVEKLPMYNEDPVYTDDILVWKKSDSQDALHQLQGILSLLIPLDQSSFDSVELIESAIKEYISSNDLQNGNVLWPLRVSLSGSQRSPSPFELLWIFGKDESLNRIQSAINHLSNE
jgi:glutamyl-tRNA synthetase